MKFSFINPSPPLSSMAEMCITAWPPLGILYCAAVLMEEGVEVSVLDQAVKGFSLKQTLDWVKKEDPDIFGFSVLNSVAGEAPKIAEQVKVENPNIIIVMENYHASLNAERILTKYSSVDVIVRGEGEYACLELTKCLEKGATINKVKGITFRNKGKIVSTPDRPLIRDVNSLPFPNRDLIDAQYTSTIYGVKVATKKFTTLLPFRGCPFKCIFCGCTKFFQGTWRPRSVENVIKELELLQSKGYEQFLFVDDNFTLNAKRVIRLSQKIRKERMNIEWFCDSRVDGCRYDVFREMVKAGCKTVYFGIESANQRILDYYNKGITPDQSRRAIRTTRKAGVDIIVGSFILGAPDENKHEVQKTLQFAHELDIDVPSLNILGTFTGTKIWDDLVTKGFIDEEKSWETTLLVPEVSPHTVPLDVIRSMIYEYFRAFYLRPKKVLTEILRTLKSSLRIVAVLNNIPKFNNLINTLKQGVGYDK